MEAVNKNMLQEAISFVGRYGMQYATNSASKEERRYFLGILYDKEGKAEKKSIEKYATKPSFQL